MPTEQRKRMRGRYPIRRLHIENMPSNIKGIYIFWCRTKSRAIYVGQSKRQTLKKRIMQEWKNSHNEELKYWIQSFGKHLDICYFEVTKYNLIGRVEATLIHWFRPIANIQGNPGKR